MEETRKCWTERQSAGTWAATIAELLTSSGLGRHRLSIEICDFLLQHLFMGTPNASPNSLLLGFLTQALSSKIIAPDYFFSLTTISDPAKPRVFKVYIQLAYLFLSYLFSGDKNPQEGLPTLLLRISATLVSCIELQFDKEKIPTHSVAHISRHPTTTEDYCRLWDSALTQSELQAENEIRKENAAMAAQVLTSLATSPSSLAVLLIGKHTSKEWAPFESRMKALHAAFLAAKRGASGGAALASSVQLTSGNPPPQYLHVLVSCFGNLLWPLTLDSTLRTTLQRNSGWRAVLLLADELEAEQPQQLALQYALQWELLSGELCCAAVWRFGQLARLAARPWRTICCRLFIAAFAAVTSAPATPSSAVLRARLFLLARLPQLFIAWNKDAGYSSVTQRTFLELSGDSTDVYNTLELALTHLSAFPSIYLHAGVNLLDETIHSFAAHSLIRLEHMRALLGRDVPAASPVATAVPSEDRVTTADAARGLLNALVIHKEWGRQGRLAAVFVTSLAHLTAPHPIIETILRERDATCAVLCAHDQLPSLVTSLFHICHRNAESATLLADALALLLYIFVRYDLRGSPLNQAAVSAALEQNQRTASSQPSAEAVEAVKPDAKRRKTGARGKAEEAPPAAQATHSPLPADAPVLRWYASWLANTAAVGAAVEGDAQQAAEVLLAELLSPVRGVPARRDGWRTLAACECVTERVLQGLVAGRLDWNSALQALTALVSEHPLVIPAVGKWLCDHQHTFPAALNSPHPEISATAAVGFELFGPQAASASAMLDVVRELRLFDFATAQPQQLHTIPSLVRESLSATVRSSLISLLHGGLSADALQKLRRISRRCSPEYFAQLLLQELSQLNSADSAAATGSAALVHAAQLAACVLATVGGAESLQYVLTAGLALSVVGLSSLASCQQLAYFYATLVAVAVDMSHPEYQKLLQPLWRALSSMLDGALSNPSVSLGFAVTLIALLQRIPACTREAPLLTLAAQLAKLGLEEMVLPLFDLSQASARDLCRQHFASRVDAQLS